MHWIDWSIVGGLIILLIAVLIVCQRFVKSTADFLVANRCAGRYLLTITSAVASLGAISVIARFEQYYVAGFSPIWWTFLQGPIGLFLAIAGWVYYRFRETRCMTMAQFFELRYSRKFRIFSGIMGWISGIFNYGIFPAVSVKFFIFFCKFPETFVIPGIPFEFSTYVCLLAFAIGMGVIFAICGGQIAIMLTDFLQGMFCNIAFLILMIFLLCKFDWSVISETIVSLHKANPTKSMIDPFATSGIKDFNVWFFIVGIALNITHSGCWQGASGYGGAALSAHEAKMSRFLGTWRSLVQIALLIFIPICAVAFFNHPAYASEAKAITDVLSGMKGQDAVQARVPMFLTEMLPVGLVGIFAAVMFAAMLSTDDTYMHSWGSIFVQDVILPFRKNPFTEKQHIWLLRGSIIFVGIFAFCFSYLFKQTEYILLFLEITGSIFTGGAGAVLIGGLYSRTGTTAGAWVAMIIGSGLALGSIAIQQLWADTLAPWLVSISSGEFQSYIMNNMKRFPINGQILAFIITIIGYGSYFTVSYFDRKINHKELFPLQKMLHRGEYDTTGEHKESGWNPKRIWRIMGLSEEFTFTDRIIFFATFGWTMLWFAVFIFATLCRETLGLSPENWMSMWKFYVMLLFFIGLATTIWLAIGGIWDIGRLFKALGSDRRNHADDGRIVDGKNAGEDEAAEAHAAQK